MGFLEWGLVIVVGGLLFGARKLPQFGRGLGEGIREFRSGMKSGEASDAPGSPASVPARQDVTTVRGASTHGADTYSADTRSAERRG